MKSITAALSTHLDQEVTTLASCWKIVRRDGQTFFFTDHDRDIVFEGDTYEAESSYDRTAIQSNSDFSVDNLDVAGILDSERLTPEEMRAGLFNRADVYIFLVNWKDPAQGALKLRRGWFGEFTLTGNGIFHTEIRGLAQALSHNFIEVYTSECRADFCDTRCKLLISTFERPATVKARGDGRAEFTLSALDPLPAPASAGAHKYWSIKPTGYPAGDKFFISEVRFRDVDGNLIKGGTSKDNIPDGMKSKKPGRLRDGDFKSSWGFDSYWNVTNKDDDEDMDISEVRWWIEFSSAVEVHEIEVIITDKFGEAISAFDLQWSDTQPTNGTAWNLAKTCSVSWTAAGQSASWSLATAGQSPYNFAGERVAIAVPEANISTYNGGTIRWTSGKNQGRVVEILNHDPATGVVTVFEGMSYPIEIGDMLVIAQGCDRSLAACKSYGNVINRRAEDYVPGNDEYMSYPDAK
jgi:hypothetical protein